MRGDVPGAFEQVVLLALAGIDGEASGRQVYDVVTTMTGREVSVAAVHITLGRLHDKGWATCTTSAPEPGRGGKPRKSYALSEAGAGVVRDQRDTLERLWGHASRNPLLRGHRP